MAHNVTADAAALQALLPGYADHFAGAADLFDDVLDDAVYRACTTTTTRADPAPGAPTTSRITTSGASGVVVGDASQLLLPTATFEASGRHFDSYSRCAPVAGASTSGGSLLTDADAEAQRTLAGGPERPKRTRFVGSGAEAK